MNESKNLDQGEAEPAQVQLADQPRRNSFLTRWLVRIGLVLFLIVLVLGGLVWYAYQAAQKLPDYYQAILEQPESEMDIAGDQFETEMLELQNSAIELGTWQAIFSQDQINGWLGYDLPNKFPDSLPAAITDPRVMLRTDEMRIVFRFESKRLTGIVECCGDLFCTQNVNQIALQIKFIRSGVLNLPIANWTDEITKIFRANGLETEWVEEDGKATVLFTMPTHVKKNSTKRLVIEAVEFLENEVALKGVTMDASELKAYEESRRANPMINPSR